MASSGVRRLENNTGAMYPDEPHSEEPKKKEEKTGKEKEKEKKSKKPKSSDDSGVDKEKLAMALLLDNMGGKKKKNSGYQQAEIHHKR